MHEDIKRFTRTGVCEDKLQTKKRMIEDVETEMRDFGYVPSIDLDPQFTVNYNRKTQQYDFVLSVYGLYVGSENSWQVSGIASGKTNLRPTPQTK